MTQDYKELIGKYITGNIEDGSGINIPLMEENSKDINKNVYDDLSTALTQKVNPSNFYVLGKVYNDQFSKLLIYGYYTKNSVNYGYIYIIDSELNKLALLTEFSSGSRMFPITALNQDENNNIYGLSVDIGANTPNIRVLLFNNIFLNNQQTGDYQAILRNSYIVPNSATNYNQNLYRQNAILKVQGEATYYMQFGGKNGTDTYIVEFTINVGSSNEWNVYTISNHLLTPIKNSFVAYKNNDTLEVHLYGIDSLSSADNYTYYEYKLVEGTLTQVNSINLHISITSFYTQVFYKNTNEIYFSLNDTTNHLLSLRKLSNGTLSTIWEQNIPIDPNTQNYNVCELHLFMVNDVVFGRLDNVISTGVYKLSVGLLQNDILYFSNVLTNNFRVSGVWNTNDLYVIPNYNLINIYIPHYTSSGNSTHKLELVYNSTNYNGSSYENINSLIPDNSVIYSGSDIVFARNLYNMTTFGATTTSTVLVPNTLLNEINLDQTNLLGKTNTLLVNNTNTITKNIYEALYINFINSINVIDEDTNIQYSQTAININTNINSQDIATMNNKKIGKIRINYQDNSETILPVDVIKNSDTDYTITITFIATEEINNIDIISSDETMTYITLDGSSLEKNNYYTLTQGVRIE